MNCTKLTILRMAMALLFMLASCVAAFSSVLLPAERETNQETASSSMVNMDFDSPQWQVYDQNARKEEYLGRKSLYLKSGFAFLKDVAFEDGVIEVDLATTSLPSFVGVIF